MTASSVSFLLTYHNEGELFRECLMSLAPNVRSGDEILVLDDASNLEPRSFVPAGLCVEILRSEVNIGPARARNILARRAKSEWLRFQDADDLFPPDYRERLELALRDASNIDFVVFDIEYFGIHECPEVLNTDALRQGRDRVVWALEGTIMVPVTTYRTSFFIELGGYDEQMKQSEDFELGLRVMRSGGRMVIGQGISARVRTRNDSWSRSNGVQVAVSVVEALERIPHGLSDAQKAAACEQAAQLATRLFALGADSDGNRATALAESFGTPKHVGRRRSFRLVAGWFGGARAERVARAVRRARGWLRTLRSQGPVSIPKNAPHSREIPKGWPREVRGGK